jgi:hypothetical protein
VRRANIDKKKPKCRAKNEINRDDGMKSRSNIEREVNEIRLKIHEETKDLTPAQYKERLDKITEAAAKKYGFNIVQNANKQ